MKSSREKIAARINSALHAVRADLDTCIEQYRLRVTAELADVIRILEGREAKDDQHALPPPAALNALALLVEDIKLKPHKGRGKDLRRIDDLVAMLLEQLRPGK